MKDVGVCVCVYLNLPTVVMGTPKEAEFLDKRWLLSKWSVRRELGPPTTYLPLIGRRHFYMSSGL